MIAAEAAIRAWVNGQPSLVGPGKPLSRGAYLRHQRSPADGSYAVLWRMSGAGSGEIVGEPAPELATARIQAQIFGGTEEFAEAAAAAYATAVEGLSGAPQRCGATGVTVLVAGNTSGPMFVPMPADGGEQYCFQFDADFVLAAQ